MSRPSFLVLVLVLVLESVAKAGAGGYTNTLDGSLYLIDPRTSKSSRLGTIQHAGQTLVLTDLGTTPRGRVYGIHEAALYEVNLKDPSKSRLVGAHDLSGPYGFCIGPDGVGYANTNDGGFYTIDLGTAKATKVGDMGGGFIASGDLVFAGERLYSAVKDAAGVETLITIDPKTGKATRIGAFTDPDGKNVRNVFGLISDEGLYGLTAGGLIVVIDPKTAATQVPDITTTKFWGATDALLEF